MSHKDDKLRAAVRETVELSMRASVAEHRVSQLESLCQTQGESLRRVNVDLMNLIPLLRDVPPVGESNSSVLRAAAEIERLRARVAELEGECETLREELADIEEGALLREVDPMIDPDHIAHLPNGGDIDEEVSRE